MREIEKYRVVDGPHGSCGDDGIYGKFVKNIGHNVIMTMICYREDVYDVVTVSVTEDRKPTIDELRMVSHMFFGETCTFVPLFPKSLSNNVVQISCYLFQSN